MTSSLVLVIFGPDKPNLLKTYWSVGGIGCILVQPIDGEDLQQSVKLLRETGEFLFDLS